MPTGASNRSGARGATLAVRMALRSSSTVESCPDVQRFQGRWLKHSVKLMAVRRDQPIWRPHSKMLSRSRARSVRSPMVLGECLVRMGILYLGLVTGSREESEELFRPLRTLAQIIQVTAFR